MSYLHLSMRLPNLPELNYYHDFSDLGESVYVMSRSNFRWPRRKVPFSEVKQIRRDLIRNVVTREVAVSP